MFLDEFDFHIYALYELVYDEYGVRFCKFWFLDDELILGFLVQFWEFSYMMLFDYDFQVC